MSKLKKIPIMHNKYETKTIIIRHATTVYQGTVQKVLVVICFVLIILPLWITVSYGQTGTISGEVTDADTDETLPGANVLLQGTNYGVSTDIDGRYTLRRVPAGEQTIIFRFMGYEEQSIEIVVHDGERVELNISLQAEYLERDEVLVLGIQRGQARALTRQRQSVSIRSIVSAEQIDRFADQTVEGALQRVAGMGHGGAANIRGVGSGMSRVSVDGQRMGSTESDRSVDLSTISADMVQELDVIKVITPNMPADALSGVINISTRRPIGGERTINVRGGGGYQPRYVNQTGPGYRMSLSYGDSPDDTYSYGVNFNYQREPKGEESFSTSWTTRNLAGHGIMDLLSSLSSQYQFGNSDRFGAGGQFTFQPTNRSTYHFQGMFNYQERNQNTHTVFTNPRIESYTSPTQTGPIDHPDLGGQIGYQTRFSDDFIHQYTVQVGGRHLLESMEMDYKIGWGHGRSIRNRYDMSWEIGRPFVDFLVDIEDRFHPKLQIAPHSPRVVYPGSDQIASTEFLDHTVLNHIDNEITSTIDFEVPFRIGKIKFGGSAIMTFQEGNEELFTMRWDGREGPADFSQTLNNTWNVFDREGISYHIPYMIDSDKFKKLYQSRLPNLLKDEDIFGESDASFYEGNENILSLYSMAELSFNIFTFLGGARVEHMIAEYKARESVFSPNDRFLGSTEVKANTNYTNIFPNAQLIVKLTNFTNVRFAYSKSIGRPTFTQLSPFRLWNYNRRTIEHGNPNLEPIVSDNLDVLVEHYFRNVGQISVGLFYKKLENFIFRETIRIPNEGLLDMDTPDSDPTLYGGWNRTTFRNGEDADIYGIEVSWQQTFSFLPGFLSNLGIFANYTYTYSEADIGRRDDADEKVLARLQDQRPHVLNSGIDYTQGRFTGQVSYQWSAPYVSSYASVREWVPSIQLQNRVYPDAFTDGANDLSLTLRYGITNNFRIWMNGSNLLNSRSINYRYNQEFYPTSMILKGTEIAIGVQVSL